MEQKLITKAPQYPELELINKEDRIFKCWGSVELRDREGDLIPMSEFKKVMPIIMKRGGLIMHSHSNKAIGKILNYEFLEKDGYPGVLITAQVYKDYDLDDEVWEAIKNGSYEGLSFGGRNSQLDVKFENGQLTKILKGVEGYEFSLVEGTGNQGATFESINYFAKSNKEDLKKDIEILKHMVESIEKKLTKEEKACKPKEKENTKYIKDASQDNTMENKSITKEDEQTSEQPEETQEAQETQKDTSEVKKEEVSLNDIAQMLQAILSKLDTEKEEPEEDEAESESEYEETDKEGKKVTLPNTPEDKRDKGQVSEKKDSVNLVQKEVAKQLEGFKGEILKALKVEKTSTPRPSVNDINKSISLPKNFKEAHELARKMRRK